MIEHAKFAYSLLGKAFEKQTKKQVGAIKSLDISNKQIECKFSQNLMKDLIRDKLKKNVNLEGIIKTDNLRFKSKSIKVYNFSEYS